MLWCFNVDMEKPKVKRNPQNSWFGFKTVCPECGRQIETLTKYRSSLTTHIVAFLMCITCCIGFVPYITPCFQDVDHFCPICKAFLGTNSRDFF